MKASVDERVRLFKKITTKPKNILPKSTKYKITFIKGNLLFHQLFSSLKDSLLMKRNVFSEALLNDFLDLDYPTLI